MRTMFLVMTAALGLSALFAADKPPLTTEGGFVVGAEQQSGRVVIFDGKVIFTNSVQSRKVKDDWKVHFSPRNSISLTLLVLNALPATVVTVEGTWTFVMYASAKA